MLKEIKLQNVETNKTLDLGPREIFVLDTIDWNVASVNHNTIFYFPSEISEEILSYTWEPRPIQIVGYVTAKIERDILEASDTITDFIGVQTEIKILYKGYYLSFYATEHVRFSTNEREDNEVLRKFQITGIALDPRWHDSTNVDKVVGGEVGPMFYFPLWFNEETEEKRVVFGRQILDTEMILTYDGVIEKGLRFIVYSESQISDIEVRNELNGDRFLLLGSYDSGEIIIDTRDGFRKATITRNGITEDITRNVEPHSIWHRLQPGTSNFSLYFNGQRDVTFFVETIHSPLFEVQQ